ncbi:MAG: MOSC domain-containing protein, partial [Pseudomonadota bacterium]
AGLPHDRRVAILRAGARLEDGFTPKSAFHQLVRDAKLAALTCHWEDDSGHLQIMRDGKPVARGAPDTPVGQALLAQFFSAFLGVAGGGVKVVARPAKDGAQGFWDIPETWVSILNAASLRELERVDDGAPAAAERFRPNLVVDLGAPWAEDGLVGAQFRIGDVAFEGVEPITRCAATSVAPSGDPEAGARDRNYLRLMSDSFDRMECGVYARVIGQGAIAIGDTVTAA